MNTTDSTKPDWYGFPLNALLSKLSMFAINAQSAPLRDLCVEIATAVEQERAVRPEAQPFDAEFTAWFRKEGGPTFRYYWNLFEARREPQNGKT